MSWIRTHKKNWRVYVDGYNMSSHTMGIGPLAHEAPDEDATTIGDAIEGSFAGIAIVKVGTLNTVLDNTADTGSHTVLNNSFVSRDVSVAMGGVTAPVSGDPCFAAQQQQLSYLADGDGMATVSIDFGTDAQATSLLYAVPWGNIIHAYGAETAANTGESDHENLGGQTTAGGFMMWHLFAADGTGTVTMSIEDDAATDGTYTSLVSSGAISAATDPISGVVALGTGVTVEAFTRWQVAFGGNTTTATFFLSFHRG